MLKLIETFKQVTNTVDSKTGKLQKRTMGRYLCGCGEVVVVRPSRAKNQKGCKHCKDTKATTHGMSYKRQYTTWQNMKDRCTNPNNCKWEIYGGKGVTYDLKWETFEGFWEDMQEGYNDKMTIDRIDSNGNYTKDNCQWISKAENNRRAVIREVKQLTKMPDGTIHTTVWACAADAAKALDLSANHITTVCKGRRKSHGGYQWTY